MLDESTVYSIKCGVASFVATYIAGVMHPLDVIKTRFQSTCRVMQAMMANLALTTKSPSTKECSKHLSRSIETKACRVSIKDFTSRY